MTDAEEQQLGAAVSERVRERYGVVQDANVHRYVTLVGERGCAGDRRKPNVPWTFVVLDTDAVNAFAAPGGFVHITRGALALIQDEAELAGVLGHEIIHVTEKHTIRRDAEEQVHSDGRRRNALGQCGAAQPGRRERLPRHRRKGLRPRRGKRERREGRSMAANKVGYAPQGLSRFLTRLQERNKDSKEKRGLFASHPDMKERLDRLTKQITRDKLTGTATVAARYTKNITYKPVALTEIALVEAGTAGLPVRAKSPQPTRRRPRRKNPRSAASASAA